MRALRFAIASILVVSSTGAALGDALRIVTTVPDLADIVREIGGERVEVQSLSQGTENLHAVITRPSMLVALSRADLFFEMGLSLESTWLPDLLLAARNRKIEPGASGFVNVSIGWMAIEVPESLSRRGGDLHPEGNPHFNLDPRAGRHFAERILEALLAVDSEGESAYRARYQSWLSRLESAEARWQRQGARLRGLEVVVYHLEFNYFVKRYGMELVTAVEPQPGIPPKPTDVARVIQLVREHEVPVILTAAWSNNRQVADIAHKGGAAVLELPNMVGGAPWADSWIALIDGIHERIAKAYGFESD
jgi:zinc/manganese transport system substrate-binding protein